MLTTNQKLNLPREQLNFIQGESATLRLNQEAFFIKAAVLASRILYTVIGCVQFIVV